MLVLTTTTTTTITITTTATTANIILLTLEAVDFAVALVEDSVQDAGDVVQAASGEVIVVCLVSHGGTSEHNVVALLCFLPLRAVWSARRPAVMLQQIITYFEQLNQNQTRLPQNTSVHTPNIRTCCWDVKQPTNKQTIPQNTSDNTPNCIRPYFQIFDRIFLRMHHQSVKMKQCQRSIFQFYRRTTLG